MQTIRTPDERFQNLDNYPFAPNYIDVDDNDDGTLRIHYLDEGPKDGEIILCMHGQPTRSYLYRKMIPILVAAGHRVIAPDLVGFGKSDKPTLRSDYTYANHVHWINALIRGLDIHTITLVCLDWGGLIGLRVVTENMHRFARVVTANTGLPDAKDTPDEMSETLHKLMADTPALPPVEMSEKMNSATDRPGFLYWIRHCDAYPEFRPADVAKLSMQNCSVEEYRAYDAPFPSEEYIQGARQFPTLVPIIPDNPAVPPNRAAWQILKTFNKPFLTAFSDSDPVTRGGDIRFQTDVPGAKGQNHVTIKSAGHFLQDDAGDELAQVVIDFMHANAL